MDLDEISGAGIYELLKDAAQSSTNPGKTQLCLLKRND